MRFYLAWVSLGVTTVALNGCFQVGDDDSGQAGQAGDDGKTGGSSTGAKAGATGATGGSSAAGSSMGGTSGRDTGSSFLGRGGTKSSAGAGGKPAAGGTDTNGGADDGTTGGTGTSTGGTGGSAKGGTGGSGGSVSTPVGTCDDYASKLKSCSLISANVDCSALPSTAQWACFYGCIKEAPCNQVVDGICTAQAANALVDCVNNCNYVVFDCGGGQTVPGSYECDGADDCDNGKDEASCPPANFACGDGTSVQSSYRCDNEPDCANGADEVGCPHLMCPLPPAPTPGEACGHAGAALKACGLLPSGTIQGCMDRTEARSCRAECFASAACANLEGFFCSVGDGTAVQTCLDGCAKLSDEFPCKADNIAIPGTWICDDTNDCSDGSDEAGCTFKCGDGTMVPVTYLCDGEADCADSSDEASCSATCPAPT